MLGSSSSDMVRFDNYDAIKKNLTDAQLQLISQWYVFQRNTETGEDELVQPEWRQEEQDEKKAQEKKNEANQIILSRYPFRKQINLNRIGGEEMQEMNTRIDAIREESTKWKDADFTQFLS